jgi:hypothetical protein
MPGADLNARLTDAPSCFRAVDDRLARQSVVYTAPACQVTAQHARDGATAIRPTIVQEYLSLTKWNAVPRVTSRWPVRASAPDGIKLRKAVPGPVSLESMLAEMNKLRAVRAVTVPAAALADVAPKVVAGSRAWSMVEGTSHLGPAHPGTPRALPLTLLAALLRLRERRSPMRWWSC